MSHPPSSTTSPYADQQGFNSDHAQGPPRKKMRKGTKSCLECRRRKIKCTFEAGRPAICNECYARGSTCIDQEHGDINSYTQAGDQASYSLRERVSQLEDLVKQVLHRLPERESTGDESPQRSERSQVDAQAAEALKSLKSALFRPESTIEDSILLPGGLRDEAPALALFDNDVITRKESQPVVSRASYNKSKTIKAALTQLLPSPQDLEIILESSHEWWTIWRQMFPEITDSRCETMKESVSHSLRSDKPAEVAKIMLCIAISVHQLPSGFDWSRLKLKANPTELMERYIETVDKLITSDEEYAATLEGLECMMLEAKYQVNMGRPRRAWLLFHRAIAFSQLLGFHRLAAQPDKTSVEYKRKLNVWHHMLLGDRFLSLILGLPYVVAENFVTPYIRQTDPTQSWGTPAEGYISKMMPIVSRLSDRNQAIVPMGYSATMSLDQELEELYAAQDPAWWSLEMNPNDGAEQHFERLQTQFFHHQVKVLLHMPFMLRSASDKRYQYSHSAALEGAREMIRIYDALRTNKLIGPFICKLIDFQAFTGAMLLLLSLCGYNAQRRGVASHQVDFEQDQLDSELIDRTIVLLKDAAKEPGGVVAAQSAQALEMLAMVRQGCDRKDECRNENCQVSIPYFGTITIGVGKQFVPIKPGTYTKRTPGSIPMSTAPNTGLPTPPSISSSSTLPSPLSHTIDHPPPQQLTRLPVFESTNFIAPGLGSTSWGDIGPEDPLITFDSFMNLPGNNMDFPTVGSGSSGYTPQTTSQSSYDPVAMEPSGLLSAGGAGFPFGNFSLGPSGAMDLDQGWNWFGVETPVGPQ